jgi:ABC-type branched-subunit amino acid transport system permease subunit
MLFGVACALVFAIILGAIALSRLRHDYLALTLFALGQGLLVLATNDTVFLGGVAGVNGVPTPFSDSLTPADAQLAFLGLGAVCLALVFLMFWRVSASPLGRALKAVRDDEEAAVALGKRVWRLKMVAFLLGGGAAGLAGSLLVIYVGGWNTGGWQATETFILLAAVIVGGRGRNVGALVGSVIVFEGIVQSVQFLPIIGPPELLPSLQPIAVGALLLAFLWWRPQGVLPEQKERFSGTTGRDSTINGLGLLAVSPPRQRDDV